MIALLFRWFQPISGPGTRRCNGAAFLRAMPAEKRDRAHDGADPINDRRSVVPKRGIVTLPRGFGNHGFKAIEILARVSSMRFEIAELGDFAFADLAETYVTKSGMR